MTHGRPSGYLTLTLHAHMPYVVNHGTWPHGLEWLLETATESYLPLLRVLARLQADGIAFKANLNMTPILLEQLAHPVFQAELPAYLERKIAAARADEEHFQTEGDLHLKHVAWCWAEFFAEALRDFEALDRDIVKGFRRFSDAGIIEMLACAATHGYFPLLGTDESIAAQMGTGLAAYRRHLGKSPRGMWLPECGYRPAGSWQMPVAPDGADAAEAPFERSGVEEILAANGLEFFFVDTHLVEESVSYTPYDLLRVRPEFRSTDFRDDASADESAAEELESSAYRNTVYKPYRVDGPGTQQHPTLVFPRDPRTGLQVWSGETGYPGDGVYLDFHKKRWPGGHRYWQVTHSKADLGLKTPYYPERASARAKVHAEHFVSVVVDALKPSFDENHPPILTSPFDAELFGHWWHEGAEWLEQVARTIAREDIPIELIGCSEYLDKYPPEASVRMKEGSWGQHGDNSVWLNPDTRWTWAHIYAAEAVVSRIATKGAWRDAGPGERIVKQLCRELLLMESSDWQFLITTGPARDYAEARFVTHLDQFKIVEKAWLRFQETGALTADLEASLNTVEARDSVFAEIDPSLWAKAV